MMAAPPVRRFSIPRLVPRHLLPLVSAPFPTRFLLGPRSRPQLHNAATGSLDETVVDRAAAWISEVASSSPALVEILGDLAASAEGFVKLWKMRQRACTTQTRNAWIANGRVRSATDMHRAAGMIARFLCRGHATFSIALGSSTQPILRWQVTSASRNPPRISA